MLLCVAEKNRLTKSGRSGRLESFLETLESAGQAKHGSFFRAFKKRSAGRRRILFCLISKELCRLKPASFAPGLLENFLRNSMC